MPLVAFSYFSCAFFGRKIECQKHGSTLCNSALEFNKTRLGVKHDLKVLFVKNGETIHHDGNQSLVNNCSFFHSFLSIDSQQLYIRLYKAQFKF